MSVKLEGSNEWVTEKIRKTVMNGPVQNQEEHNGWGQLKNWDDSDKWVIKKNIGKCFLHIICKSEAGCTSTSHNCED